MLQRFWRFYDFVDRGGENHIYRWLHEQSPNVRAYFNSLILNLERLDRAFTRPDKVGLLRKAPCKKEQLIELIGKISDVQYRLIGWYGPERREVTLLIGATERDHTLVPRNACLIAIDRKHLARSGRRYIRDHNLG